MEICHFPAGVFGTFCRPALGPLPSRLRAGLFFYIMLPGMVLLPIVFGIILGRQAGRWEMEKVNILLWALLLSLLHWMAYCLPQVLWCLTNGTDLWYAFDLFYLLSAVGLGAVFFAAALLTGA